MAATLSDQQLTRYGRQMILPSMPEDAQERLLSARVLIVGLGGLGCPVACFLSRAGVGYLGLVDPDRIELGNIHRQILFDDDDIGRLKVDVVREKVEFAAPDTQMETFPVTIQNFQGYERWDLVIDCCDHYTARKAVADYAHDHAIPLLSASVLGFSGQITTILPEKDTPSFDALYPEIPEDAPSQCEQIGVLGPTVGVFGSLLAMEAMKMIVGIGETFSGKVLVWDGLHHRVQMMKL